MDVVNAQESVDSSQIIVNLLLSLILFSSVGMCFEIFALKKEKTLRRSLATGNRPGVVIGGILGAQFLLTVIGYILIFLICSLSFTPTALSKAPVIILNIVMITAVALSLSIFVSRVVKNENMIIVVLQLLLVGICFVGGSFVPLEMLPKSLTLLSRFTPQYWAIESIKTSRYEYSLIVLLFAIVLFTAGTVSVRSFSDD